MRIRRPILLLAVCALVVPMLVTACGKTVGETIDDATITTRVKTALLNDPDVGGMRIDVDTALGVVTLSGVAKTRNEEQKAVAVARRIPGVKDVKSTLQINPGLSSPDPDRPSARS
jgi:hyperosmotically inducible protein